MGKLGSRLLFFEMPSDEQRTQTSSSDLAGGESYRDRVERCRGAVAEFLERSGRRPAASAASPGTALRPERADAADRRLREGAGAVARHDLRLARRLGRRRVLQLLDPGHRGTASGDEPAVRARARARAHPRPRASSTEDDMPIVARAALESTPNDRRAVMRLLFAKEGIVRRAMSSRRCAVRPRPRRAILETLDQLGVGRFENPGAADRGALPPRERLQVAPRSIESGLTSCARPLKSKPTPCTTSSAPRTASW